MKTIRDAADVLGMGSARDPRDSAFAVLLRDDKVLLVRTRRGRWQLPGGHVERGETLHSALHREMHEETGLRIRILGRTGVYPRSDDSRAVVFAGEAPPDARPVGPRNEIREQRWVPVRKARRLLRPRSRQRLNDALS